MGAISFQQQSKEKLKLSENAAVENFDVELVKRWISSRKRNIIQAGGRHFAMTKHVTLSHKTSLKSSQLLISPLDRNR